MSRLWSVIAIAAVFALGSATTAWSGIKPELRPFVGAYVPTGDQRNFLKDAVIFGGQAALEMADAVHLVGTVGYAPNRDRTRFQQRDVGIYQYDLGLEAFGIFGNREGWQARPFVGAGAGGRTFDRKRATQISNLVGYGALGTEIQSGNLAVRFEGRDYVSRFRGLTGDLSAEAHNDLMFLFGAAFHW